MGLLINIDVGLSHCDSAGILSGDNSIFTLERNKLGHKAGIAGGIIGILTCFGYQTGNITATSATLSVLFGGSFVLWCTVIVGLAIVLISLKELYKKIEIAMLGMVFLMVIAFVGTLFITGFRQVMRHEA